MHQSANPGHASHDTLLIAGHAAGDLTDTQASAASALLAACSDCSLLHRDLIAIATATQALPRAAHAPRDYRLTADHAASLRRGNWLRALLRPFASANSAARPMAAAFTSLGVAGLLVAAFVPGLLGTAASAPTGGQERDALQGAPAPTAAPEVAPAAGGHNGPGASYGTGKADYSTADPEFQVLAGAGSGSAGEQGNPDDAGTLNTAAPPPNPLILGSLALLALGLAIFGLRLAARRIR